MFLFYVNEFSCTYVYHVCVWCPQKSEEGVRVLDLKLWMVESRHVGGCWDLNLSPLQEQQVFLTQVTSPALICVLISDVLYNLMLQVNVNSLLNELVSLTP